MDVLVLAAQRLRQTGPREGERLCFTLWSQLQDEVEQWTPLSSL